MSILNAIEIRTSYIKSGDGTTGLTVDNSGIVSRPVIPAFTVWNTAPTPPFTPLSGNIILNTPILNSGDWYSSVTGNFTTPIPGLYYFSFTGFTENNASGGNNIEIRRNNQTVVRTFTSEAVNTYRPFATECIISLDIYDTVRPWSAVDLHPNQNPVFTGYFLG